MRYYLRKGTLILRGSFRAASTGISGGLSRVSSILNHTLEPGGIQESPERELQGIIAGEGLPPDFFGLITSVNMNHLCILQYDFITTFITAGIPSGTAQGHTINLVLHSREGMTDAALLECIAIATEAKTSALASMGYYFSGTPGDSVIAACEGDTSHESAGILSDIGSRIFAAVRFGIPEALHRHDGTVSRNRPSFFIYSRFEGDHWVEWLPDQCPYYPCHFAGQACDFCYCPFYPCSDETLGQWVKSSSQHGVVWNCSPCTLLHQPDVAKYLADHPEASLEELKAKIRLKK
ncbi:MAG: adenosylcobinamide amidohydrolase [Methanolinea sp.]|nr:adenosylcobinamide amidohydrolase [Methanolinea sp.]